MLGQITNVKITPIKVKILKQNRRYSLRVRHPRETVIFKIGNLIRDNINGINLDYGLLVRPAERRKSKKNLDWEVYRRPLTANIYTVTPPNRLGDCTRINNITVLKAIAFNIIICRVVHLVNGNLVK